jgi:hypothetical protein
LNGSASRKQNGTSELLSRQVGIYAKLGDDLDEDVGSRLEFAAPAVMALSCIKLQARKNGYSLDTIAYTSHAGSHIRSGDSK